MLDTESFKSVVVFQAWNALTAAQANAEARNQIEALQQQVSKLTAALESAGQIGNELRKERDEAMAKLTEIANAAARTMLANAETPAGPQDEPISEGGTPD